MKSALIGHTGFVGSNLKTQNRFDDFYRSTDIEKITGKHYGQIVCAGAPAIKWQANKEPEKDWQSLQSLMKALEKVTTDELILVSTVDVYPLPIGVDENSGIDKSVSHSYGKHRLLFEEFIQARFSNYRILRLPALFGDGLKKNIIFDFLHGNQIENVDSESRYQWYPVDFLWRDIQRMISSPVRLLNMAVEPLLTREVLSRVFGRDFKNVLSETPPRYDFRTIHAVEFGGKDGYLYREEVIYGELEKYVSRARQSLVKGNS